MRIVYSGEAPGPIVDGGGSAAAGELGAGQASTKTQYKAVKRNNRWCNHEWYSLKRRSEAKAGKGGRNETNSVKFRVAHQGVESWKTLEEVLGRDVAAKFFQQ
jgi:hypothetical protein